MKSGGIRYARQPLPAPLVLGFDRLPRQRFFDHEIDAPVERLLFDERGYESNDDQLVLLTQRKHLLEGSHAQ